ncbi:tRNA/U2 snRNA pseudouridine synthase Lsp1 [Schizosaccharomyces pombe]|uniref:tRNA pseudouridine synthase 1 n=1 Tax=Schizosaccharomyces pombe (strain 972 / ATCC 24843) TaxID=284812 RepID=PUS1_SCHPO|nr:tRNA pseudouridine synthase Lsp1 [Schizosaccharomyces pombe]O94396.1 RecName: Full=tRNA pseudouridine synthase 1; AltName: Full=tRNA pseudouridylate synthase 1; AltName: Full=tRNA-uridine isomerase 1 [Schizosaccharomyces pombe 972h-]CAA22472.1 tRNA pseudouridine synthase Lsp1 [Schizosaccharomyces pombe]CAB61835.1 pseudouridine synthase [Schizosaccharomyces pombe]|eukprot:NP_588446.1 tRNA pseudouridine synthase Lsp1 [Schizosaccharomyces pombe]
MGRGGKRTWYNGDRREAKRNRPNSIYNGEGRPENLVVGEKKPKRKVACLVGYCGSGYHGMQLNPPSKTIEGDLFDAFVKAGAVSSYNADDPKKVALARAARTDKGVHAAGNVISLKLIMEDEKLIEKVNEHLPPSIRLWDVIRTINSFNPRTYCESRIYEYMVPTYAFVPPKPSSILGNCIMKNSPMPAEPINKENINQLSRSLFYEEGKEFWDDYDIAAKEILSLYEQDPEGFVNPYSKRGAAALANSENNKGSEAGVSAKTNPDMDSDSSAIVNEFLKPDSVEDESAGSKIDPSYRLERALKHIEVLKLKNYRISADRLSVIRETLNQYVGVHNFHNFTVGQAFHQKNSNRVIRSFTASDPFMIGDTEWISCKVHGQSFMLHQIRKMIALAILVVRTGCPVERIQDAFKKTKINIPKGPGFGLLLESPFFKGYNEHKAPENNRDPIDFTKYEQKITAFKHAHIYDKIFLEEARKQVFHCFLSFIDSYNEEDFSYLSDIGITEKTQEVSSKLPDVLSSDEEEDSAENKDDLEG